ncbi:MAG: hypothetical protein HY909_28085 [Deltaproteobacteria bacterium]|nr:hypothetical protein [Deltaproteobacteria bacterium]
MILPSRLGEGALSGVLSGLLRDGASGELELDGGVVRHGIHLRRGRVQAVESAPRVAVLGDLLVARGEVSREAVERAAKERGGALLGHALLAAGRLTARQRDRALDQQRRERLGLASRCAGASLRFHPGKALPPGGVEASALEDWVEVASAGARGGAPRRGLCALLGLPVESPDGALRAAFRRRVRALHPDLGAVGDPRALCALLESYRAWDRG